MKKIWLIIVLLLFQCSCASVYVLKEARREVARQKAMDLPPERREEVFRAIDIDDGIGVGIEVSNLEALQESGWKSFMAALLDAGFAYGAKELLSDLTNGNKDDGEDPKPITININNGQDVDVNVDSGGTDVNITVQK